MKRLAVLSLGSILGALLILFSIFNNGKVDKDKESEDVLSLPKHLALTSTTSPSTKPLTTPKLKSSTTPALPSIYSQKNTVKEPAASAPKTTPELKPAAVSSPILSATTTIANIATTSVEISVSAVPSGVIAESPINLQSIVLIRCIFQSQYYRISSQPWGEERYVIGSGIIVSPRGLILTVEHILEVQKELLNDPAGRKWERIKCEAARTDSEQTPIPAIGSWGDESDSRFQPAEIIFEPTISEYKESYGLDFAVLKISSAAELPFTSLVPDLIKFQARDEVLAVGYPGRDSSSPQKLERFDGKFLVASYYPEAPCDTPSRPCGLRYVFRRYPYDYEKDFWKQTPYGIVTPYFRGGFSGAPAFFKGNLVGIITHGVSGSQADDGWDQVVILSSYDIALKLKENNLASY